MFLAVSHPTRHFSQKEFKTGDHQLPMKVIIVTGTPGSGKTKFAKRLSRKPGFEYIDVNKLIAKHKLHQGYDANLKTKIVDTNKLSKFLISYINKSKAKGVIIDSHLSHYLPPSFVDECYVTTCDLKELRQRLKKRGYSARKIRDNLEAEAFSACLTEAQDAGHETLAISTSKTK